MMDEKKEQRKELKKISKKNLKAIRRSKKIHPLREQGRILKYGTKGFVRNIWLSSAATVVMSITLIILFATVVASVILTNTAVMMRDKIDITIYLKPNTSQEKLEKIGKYTKTIIFCPDQEEAAKMRDLLVALNPKEMSKSPNYIMRITSEDKDGKKMLDRFIDPESKYPTIVTTSELLSTGVDCKTCGLIVIDKEVNSMTLFKQMIGRGTRIYIDKERKINKWHFEILDFRDATRLFFDPEFDGEPELNTDKPRRTSKDGDSKPAKGTKIEIAGEEIDEEKFQKIHIEGSKRVAKLNEIYYVISDDGQALEISDFLDYTRKGILRRFPKFTDFARLWTETDRKTQIIDDFKDHDILIEEVRRSNPNLANADVFDIICHVAYDMKPLTREERANNVKKRNYFGKYGDQARQVLEALLDKYAELGVRSLEDRNILSLEPFAHIGTPVKITKLFGGTQGYQTAIHELEQQLYSA